MCLGAIYWARPQVIYFANNRQDAAAIGFDDSMIYEEMNIDIDQRRIPLIKLGREAALKIFEHWGNKENKTKY
jgi:tRNA(Arg) A34 adenosine deaminase TadA